MHDVIEATRVFFERRNRGWMQGDLEELVAQSGRQPSIEEMLRRRALHARRQTRDRKVISDLDILSVATEADGDGVVVRVRERLRFIYESQHAMSHEQREYHHELVWSDQRTPVLVRHRQETEQDGPMLEGEAHEWSGQNGAAVDRDFRGIYNRTLAYRYAEQWWNVYNPAYADMGVDCTNFVSQVMRAGGFAMIGGTRKETGWWYRSGRTPTWSYSWAVAQSLATLLQRAGNPFRATLAERPEELTIGDVIAYDWTGSGRYGHNTVVVGADERGLPLVNAHTVNSHQRFFSYEDSYAWTQNTRYLFVHFMN
ncbi:MAG: amidase domain-containing protein [Firmicutes bacterium]|nr:amidase domain-containing protein [Bacillota bacterium]